jgi:uncharacterized membrane protein
MKAHNQGCRDSALSLFFLFCCGALIYMGIEIGFRGFTHWTMGIVGGICFLLIGGLNNYIDWGMPVIKQAIIGGIIITALELIAGLILNVWLGLGIWSYASMPFNFMGQICLPFSCLWCLLSIVAVYVDDTIRWIILKEPFPKHKWF